MLQPIDYDIDISEIFVAHSFTIEPNEELDIYRNGRNMYGLICPISGAGEFCFSDGTKIALQQGEVGLISPIAAYRLHTVDERPFYHYTVNFESPSKGVFPEWGSNSSLFVLKPNNLGLYQTRLDEMSQAWKRIRTCYRLRVKGELMLLLADFLSEATTSRLDAAYYHQTLPAKRMIESQYSEQITLSDLAQACNMTTAAFRQAFTAVYQQPPISYLNQFRVEKAKQALLMGVSISDVAVRCGFNDISYFIRYFGKKQECHRGNIE